MGLKDLIDEAKAKREEQDERPRKPWFSMRLGIKQPNGRWVNTQRDSVQVIFLCDPDEDGAVLRRYHHYRDEKTQKVPPFTDECTEDIDTCKYCADGESPFIKYAFLVADLDQPADAVIRVWEASMYVGEDLLKQIANLTRMSEAQGAKGDDVWSLGDAVWQIGKNSENRYTLEWLGSLDDADISDEQWAMIERTYPDAEERITIGDYYE